MKSKLFRFLFVMITSLVIFSGCKTGGKGEFVVSVSYKNLDKMVAQPGESPLSPGATPGIMLQEIPYGGDMNPVIIDSATLKENNGKLELNGKAKEESIFQVVVEGGPMLLVVNDAETIEVEIDLSKAEDYYTIKGSPASQKLKEFIYQYSERSFVINQRFGTIDSLKQVGGSDSLLIVATEQKNQAVNDLNSYMQQFINNSDNPALSLFALGWSSRSFPRPEFETALNTVVARFPEHATLKKLKTTYDMQQAQANQQQQQQQNQPAPNSWVGKQAPELSLPDPQGKLISVSSFRGKYVLIDFWASWCGPCRQENPNVVKAFNQHKNKNFTILGVSLDQQKDAWLEAIKKDQLNWTHISDLKFWDSKAVEIYQFEGIPYNVLVDPKGTIIAENLRGFDLENKLQEVLP